MFTYIPILLQYIVPPLQSHFSDEAVYVIMVTGTIAFTTAVYNIPMYFIYTRKYPFFEQYRISPNVTIPLFRGPGRGRKTLTSSKNYSGGASK